MSLLVDDRSFEAPSSIQRPFRSTPIKKLIRQSTSGQIVPPVSGAFLTPPSNSPFARAESTGKNGSGQAQGVPVASLARKSGLTISAIPTWALTH